MRKEFMFHVVLPALAPALFFGVAAIPVELIGCRNRGLAVLAIAFISILGALFAGGTAAKNRLLGGTNTAWWIVTSIILAIPAIALMILV